MEKDLTVTESFQCADLKITEGAGSYQAEKKINVTSQAPNPQEAAGDGDLSFSSLINDGEHLGWYFTNGTWAKFGLTDTGNLKITGGSPSGTTWSDGAGDLQLKNGLGLDIQAGGTLNVANSATTLGGNLTVTGTSEFNGTVDVDADFAVRNGTTDKFFVDNVTGNTNIEGTLTVDGNITLGNNASGDQLTLNCAINSALRPTNTLANLDIGSQSQKWRDGHFSCTLHATAITGISTISANVTGALTGNADTATQVYVTDNANATDYKILFATAGGTGANRDVYTDANSLYFNPNSNTLGVSNIACSSVGNGSTSFDGCLLYTSDAADE